MSSEADFKKKLMKKLRAINGVWCESINQIAISGTPDIIGCYRGRFFAIECKRDGASRVAEIQEYTLERIRGAGGMAFIWHPGNYEAMFEDFFRAKPREIVKRGQIRVYRREE